MGRKRKSELEKFKVFYEELPLRVNGEEVR